MSLETVHRLVKFVIILIDRVLLLGWPDDQTPMTLQFFPQQAAGVGIIRNTLSNDVRSACQGVLDRLDPLAGIHIVRRQPFRHLVSLLEQQHRRQWLQPLLLGHGGTGAALGTVGTVEILQLGQGVRFVQLGTEGGGELALGLDGLADLLPPSGQVAQVIESIRQLTEHIITHAPVGFFSVAGDKGDGVAFVQERDHCFHMGGMQGQLLRQLLNE